MKGPKLKSSWLALVLVACTLATVAIGQFRRQRGPYFNRGNVPQWQLEPEFKDDCFTFARIKYRSTRDSSSYAWWTDYPDADLNLSWRLHQLTSMKVAPDGTVIELTDEELMRHPFVFMSGVPAIDLSRSDIEALRRYLLKGGFLLVDDFWGERNWDHFYDEVLDRLFPNCEPKELPLQHPIFHAVFDMKEKPQIPSVGYGVSSRATGITWEVPDGKTPHYRAVYDEKGRLMILICHNTDLGDGWEEEATDPYYFSEFSEKKAYPLGINILFYIMTH